MTAITRTPGKLRAVLEEAKRSGGHSLSDMTVLAAQNDPYRVDTPAGHRDAVWFKDQLDRALACGDDRVAILATLRPDRTYEPCNRLQELRARAWGLRKMQCLHLWPCCRCCARGDLSLRSDKLSWSHHRRWQGRDREVAA